MAHDTYSYDSDTFLYDVHHERFKIILDQDIMEERSFNLSPNEYLEIHQVLKKHKLSKLVALDLVLEFYANAYRPSFEQTEAEPTLLSWVRGREILYDWKLVSRVLKMKYRELQC